MTVLHVISFGVSGAVVAGLVFVSLQLVAVCWLIILTGHSRLYDQCPFTKSAQRGCLICVRFGLLGVDALASTK